MSWNVHALGINARNLIGIAPRNGSAGIALVRDKVRTKAVLEAAGVPVPRTLSVISDMWGLARLEEVLVEPAVIKPASGSGGGGILLLEPDNGGYRTPGGNTLDLTAVERHAAAILHGGFSYGGKDSALVEAMLQPHPDVAALHGRGIADVRVIHIDGRPALSMLRMPSARSDGKANLHQGGVAAPVSRKGVLGPVFDGRGYGPNHMDGPRVEGCRLPFWAETLEVSAAAAAAVPLEYVGIDIVLTTEGPVVLEVNARPGLAIQNVNRKSLKEWL